MSNFFILESYAEPDDLFVKRYEDPDDYDDACYEGQRIAATERRARLFYEAGKKTDLVAGIFSFPVVSARFRELLCALEPAHTELHPVQLVCTRSNEVDDSYAFLNILDPVSCLDRQRSHLVVDPAAPERFRVRRLVLQEEVARGRRIFRLSDRETLIIADAMLRERVEDARLSGIRFMDVADYTESW